MPIFDSLFDEERRKRLALTPGINPNAPPTLPDLPVGPAPRPRPRILSIPGPMPGAPGESSLPETITGRAPMRAAGTPDMLPGPGIKSPTRYEEYGEARDVFLKGTPGRGKSGLIGGLRGVGPGLQEGGLAGGLGGLVGGLISGVVNPRGLREMEFNERIRPQILDRFAMEDQERAQQAAQAKAAADQAMTRMQLANLGSQIQERTAAGQRAVEEQAFKQRQPTILQPGATVYDPRTQQPVFTAPIAERPMTSTDPRLDIEPTSGKSSDQIAIESYMERGGDDYVLSKMPARQQEILRSGTVNGEAVEAGEIAAAQRAFENAKRQQLEMDKAYTRGDVRGRNITGRKPQPAQRKGQPGRRAISVQEAEELLK